MSSPEVGDLCEGCRKPNAWMLIDPIYTYVCGGCAEKGTADVLWNGKFYRGFRTCKGCGIRVVLSSLSPDGRLFCFSCDKERFLGGVPPLIP